MLGKLVTCAVLSAGVYILLACGAYRAALWLSGVLMLALTILVLLQ